MRMIFITQFDVGYLFLWIVELGILDGQNTNDAVQTFGDSLSSFVVRGAAHWTLRNADDDDDEK